jgi:hypothetical protein
MTILLGNNGNNSLFLCDNLFSPPPFFFFLFVFLDLLSTPRPGISCVGRALPYDKKWRKSRSYNWNRPNWID